MADAADSKSVTLKSVRVQVPPPALNRSLENQRSQGFSSALRHNLATFRKKVLQNYLTYDK